MARIRSIKPEFPQSETVGKLSRDARLLFIQLWTIVDDSGRARGASRMLASLLYPYDDDAPALIDGWMDELEREGCIRRYEVDGSQYIDLPNWLKHQKIDKPSASKLPEFAEPSRSLATDLGPRKGIKDLGEEQSSLRSDSPLAGGDGVQPGFALTAEEPPDGLDIPEVLRRYPEEFEDLWREYRVIGSPNASKAAAHKAWAKLPPGDRQACWTGLVRYAAWLIDQRQKRPDYPAKHLATFISERGWEPFLEDAA